MATADEECRLAFTGKMSVVLELEGYSTPMEIAVNDKDLVLNVLRELLLGVDDTVTVQTQPKAKGRTLRRLLDSIP